jgi:carboxypeptidase Q
LIARIARFRVSFALLLCVSTRALAQTVPPAAPDQPINEKADLLTKAAVATQPATAPTTVPASNDPTARIRDEGLNHSQVMQTLSYLSDVIGPRLTGSPQLRRANGWTRQRLASWGLENAHLESWGPFGRGWSLKRYSAQIVEPQAIPLIGYPKAWSPGFDRPVTARVVYLDAKTVGDLDRYRGTLKGAIVLVGDLRELQARFDPLALRVSDSDLLQLSNADASASSPPGLARTMTPSERRAMFAGTPLARLMGRGGARATTGPSTGPTTGPGRLLSPGRAVSFLMEEGAAVMVSPSTQGDGGTFFVASAALPIEDPGPTSRPANFPRPWSVDPPATLPQLVLAVEHYNRLIRMIQAGEKLTMTVDLQVQFHDDDLMAYNTVAEIPGADLKHELVMLGAHMDSWHSGTGATDNGAGVAAVMEAVRILRAAHLQPRRTIRIALWTGEEEGLFGSKAYVTKHFGSYPDAANGSGARRGRRPTTQPSSATTSPQSRPARKLIRGPEYESLSVYFNLDNGTGKIRGVYMEGNEAVRPIFRRWLAPFADLGAATLTPSTTGGTDHVSFNAVGLPGFQFIQDPIEYWTRTHHSNQDVFDRIQADDLKQAATILASFVYNASIMDDRMPRKPGS